MLNRPPASLLDPLFLIRSSPAAPLRARHSIVVRLARAHRIDLVVAAAVAVQSDIRASESIAVEVAVAIAVSRVIVVIEAVVKRPPFPLVASVVSALCLRRLLVLPLVRPVQAARCCRPWIRIIARWPRRMQRDSRIARRMRSRSLPWMICLRHCLVIDTVAASPISSRMSTGSHRAVALDAARWMRPISAIACCDRWAGRRELDSAKELERTCHHRSRFSKETTVRQANRQGERLDAGPWRARVHVLTVWWWCDVHVWLVAYERFKKSKMHAYKSRPNPLVSGAEPRLHCATLARCCFTAVRSRVSVRRWTCVVSVAPRCVLIQGNPRRADRT